MLSGRAEVFGCSGRARPAGRVRLLLGPRVVSGQVSFDGQVGAGIVVISAKIEEELAQLDPDEAAMFLEEMGLEEAGLDRLIRAGYHTFHLNVISSTDRRSSLRRDARWRARSI